MQEALNQKIDAFVAANKEQILKDIATLVSINSVEGTPEEGAPYGAGPRAALDKTLELAAGMGLATRNCENHIGYAELAGADAEKYLATICHVDVVPEGNGWTEDPFKMEIRDGWMIGRGVADDKGPMVATLYALKFLKEEGVSLRYPIRALVGDNEETHMHDVDYYLANYPAPVFCFTPDAEFPVCNGEKGHFDGKLVSPVCNGFIKDFVGGVATNAVPDRASALVATDITKLRNAPNITLEPEGDGVRIRGWGKSGHAAMPEGTVNAIGLVVNYLLDNGLCNDAERAYLEAVKKLHDSTAGVGLGIDCADGPFGPLTIIGGKMSMVDGRMVQTMDSRYPTCTDGDTIAKQIRAAIGTGAELTDVGSAKPFYIEADTPAIKACIDTYNEVTGENATPFTMGGGTYARHFPYAVSFGPEHSDMVLPEFGGPMHGANEAAPIDKLLEALKIYIIALLRLEVIDGQGGGLGRQLTAALAAGCPDIELTAVGTNSIAASAMLKAGAHRAATGENAVVVNCRRADIIVGPIGIVIADSLLGEITPAMAAAVCQSSAARVLIPINHCDNIVVGVPDQPIGQLVAAAVEKVKELIR